MRAGRATGDAHAGGFVLMLSVHPRLTTSGIPPSISRITSQTFRGVSGLTLEYGPGFSVDAMTTTSAMNVAALAQAAEVGSDTIRYYERVGLLEPPPRTSGDHRRYDDTALDRLWFIRGAQRLGLRLTEIRELLNIRDQGQCPCEDAAALLRARLVEIDREIARLQRLRGEVAHMIENIPRPDCPDPAPGTWRPRRR